MSRARWLRGVHGVRGPHRGSERRLSDLQPQRSWEHNACGVKKLDSAGTAVLVVMAGAVQTARLADLSAVPALCGFVRLLACRGGERELEIVVLRDQVAILRRGGRRPQYTAADRALLAAVSRLLPPRAVVVLCGQPADAPPLAPGAAAGQTPTAPPPARSSAACGRDTQPDPPDGAGKPSLGLYAHPG